MSEEHTEHRLIAALRATADAVAADTVADQAGTMGDGDIVFTLDLEQDGASTLKRRRWLPVAVAAAVAAVIAAVTVIVAGAGPSRVQPGGPGKHQSPTPSVPYATSAAPSSNRSCPAKVRGSCVPPAPSSGAAGATSTTPSGHQPVSASRSTGAHR